MSRGGYRPGAGRPRGARDRTPRKPVAPPPEDPAAERAFVEACNLFVASGEPYRILQEFLNSLDQGRRAWALDKLLSYGVGTPSSRKERDDTNAGDSARRLAGMTLEQKLELMREQDRMIESLRRPPEPPSRPLPSPQALITGAVAPQEAVTPDVDGRLPAPGSLGEKIATQPLVMARDE